MYSVFTFPLDGNKCGITVQHEIWNGNSFNQSTKSVLNVL